MGVPSQPKELSLLLVDVQHQGPVQLERPEAHRGEARAPLQPEHEGRGGGLLLGGAEPEEEAAIALWAWMVVFSKSVVLTLTRKFLLRKFAGLLPAADHFNQI